MALIEYISPSKYDYVSQCLLRYVFDSEFKNGTEPRDFNPYSFLGILIHAVIEAYFKKEFVLEDFEKAWEHQLKSQIEAEENIDDAALIKYHCPYYIIKKNLTYKLLTNFDRLPNSIPEPEKPIKTIIIRGSIDLYEKSDTEIKITDFKTGPIFSYADGERIGVKKTYIDQLKTYGLAVYEDKKTQKTPIPSSQIRLALVGLNEDEYFETTFNDHEYKEHKSSIESLISEINSETNIYKLGTPSPKTCEYCTHNMKCKSLHNDLLSNSLDWGSKIIITILNVEYTDDSTQINILTDNGRQSIHRIPIEDFKFIKSSINDQKKIFVKGLYQVSNSRIKRWNRFTQYQVL